MRCIATVRVLSHTCASEIPTKSTFCAHTGMIASIDLLLKAGINKCTTVAVRLAVPHNTCCNNNQGARLVLQHDLRVTDNFQEGSPSTDLHHPSRGVII